MEPENGASDGMRVSCKLRAFAPRKRGEFGDFIEFCLMGRHDKALEMLDFSYYVIHGSGTDLGFAEVVATINQRALVQIKKFGGLKRLPQGGDVGNSIHNGAPCSQYLRSPIEIKGSIKIWARAGWEYFPPILRPLQQNNLAAALGELTYTNNKMNDSFWVEFGTADVAAWLFLPLNVVGEQLAKNERKLSKLRAERNRLEKELLTRICKMRRFINGE